MFPPIILLLHLSQTVYSFMKNVIVFCVLVGEPLPTAAWEWYFGVVGKEKCVLVDTYWQTGMVGC